MLQKIFEERHSKRKARTDKNRQKINENIKKNAFYNHINHCLSVLLPVLFAGRTDFPHLVVIGSVFSAVWDMQYVILQRYNRPKLVRLMKDLQNTAATTDVPPQADTQNKTG